MFRTLHTLLGFLVLALASTAIADEPAVKPLFDGTSHKG